MSDIALHVLPDGRLRYIHDDTIAEACRALGDTVVKRASFVEPDDNGGWSVDLAPVNGPYVPGFESRYEALHFETCWLRERLGQLHLFEPSPAGRPSTRVHPAIWITLIAIALWLIVVALAALLFWCFRQ